MRKYKLAVIGTGPRSRSYLKTWMREKDIEICAIADLSPETRQSAKEQCSLSGSVREYGDWRELNSCERELDGAAIILPNHLHHDAALAFLKRGIPIMLEKPMTTTMKDSEDILRLVSETHGRVLMGYVLRSVEFYKQAHALLESGVIGNIVSVQMDELAGLYETSAIQRGEWRRQTCMSGGAMMEKCSHDMDILAWFAGGRPTALNSFGGSRIFRPNPMLPDQCRECHLEKECIYFKEDALCIWNADKDVADTQSVNMEFSNGIVANFMLTFHCFGERAGRNLHLVGTRGRLWGNAEMNELAYQVNGENEARRVSLPVHASGHYGGDEPHALEFLKLVRDPSYRPRQDAYAGYLSNAMCIAADLSMSEGRRVRFHYDADGFLSFSS